MQSTRDICQSCGLDQMDVLRHVPGVVEVKASRVSSLSAAAEQRVVCHALRVEVLSEQLEVEEEDEDALCRV